MIGGFRSVFFVSVFQGSLPLNLRVRVFSLGSFKLFYLFTGILEIRKSQDLAKDIGGTASKAEKKICKSKNCI